MSRTDFTALNDPDSELTRQALRTRCIIGGCLAKPGAFCLDTITGQPLHQRWGRYTHLARLLDAGKGEDE